jgi:hypothetical protein
MPAFTGSSYTNNLRNQGSIDNDFTDFSNLKEETYSQELPFANATFTANQSTGIELVAQTPLIAQGAKVFKYSLPASQSWQIDIKTHISGFSTQFPDAYYYAGLTFGKLGDSFNTSVINRVNVNHTRSSETNQNVTLTGFKNTLNTAIYSNNDPGTPPYLVTPENIFIRVTYNASTFTSNISYSFNGNNYQFLETYDLKSQWAITSADKFWVSIAGTSKPFDTQQQASQYPNSNYNLNSGELYLSDFNITILNNASNNQTPSSVVTQPATSAEDTIVNKKSRKTIKNKASSSKKTVSSKLGNAKKKTGKKTKKSSR